MSHTTRITPAGRLIVEAAYDAEPALAAPLATEIEAAFAESNAAGLLRLVSQALDVTLPPALVFWREFAQRYFHDVCHLGEDTLQKWSQLQPPPDAELLALASAAPPMRGLEYLSESLLRAVARATRFGHPAGQGACRRSCRVFARRQPDLAPVGPSYISSGREQRDGERPFAFLATYTHRVSSGSKLKHLPLGQALKEYAGTRNRARLTALLEPVRRAAAESTLVRELLDTRAVSAPSLVDSPGTSFSDRNAAIGSGGSGRSGPRLVDRPPPAASASAGPDRAEASQCSGHGQPARLLCRCRPRRSAPLRSGTTTNPQRQRRARVAAWQVDRSRS